MYNILNSNGVIKVTFDEQKEVSYKDFREAVKYLIDCQDKNYNYESKVKVIYKEPSTIYSRGKHRSTKSTDVKFFLSYDSVCYTTTGRTGFYVDKMSFQNVKELLLKDRSVFRAEIEEKNEKKKVSQFKRVLKERYDDVTWSNLNKNSFEPGSRFYDITKCNFPSFVYRELEQAFKNKKSYHYKEYGDRRDFSVETKMSEDGIFRAWFSSEYAGCGNGQYYLLLNPKIAIFCEND